MDNSIKKNVSYSFFAQFVSICAAFLLNLVVPKFVDEIQYAYWQTYVLYSSFVGILHLGILDGIGLRYAGCDFDNLDIPLIRSQYMALFFMDILFVLLIIILSFHFTFGAYRCLAILVAASVIPKHLYTYNFYLFQMTNRIKLYAAFVIVNNLVCMFLIIMLLFLSVNNFVFLCLTDILCIFLSCIIFSKCNKGLYIGKPIKSNLFFPEFKENISCGFVILIATWSSMFLLGSTKMLVQRNWNEIIFGKVSFAFSLTSLFLSFVTAASIALFPSLKRKVVSELPDTYMKIRNFLSPMLFSALVLYYPIYFILEKWIPKYEVSLRYLALVLPIIVYTSKVTLLTNNYIKTYRKERYLLIINVVMLAVSICLVGLATIYFKNLELALLLAVFSVALRSIISEFVVSKLIKKNLTPYFVKEFILTAIFLCSTNLLNFAHGFYLYLASLSIYMISYAKKFMKET